MPSIMADTKISSCCFNANYMYKGRKLTSKDIHLVNS